MMGRLDRDTVVNACRQFRSMVEAVVAVDGKFLK
jgi:hypothetical protein